jgi:tryptophan synthase alpha chain
MATRIQKLLNSLSGRKLMAPFFTVGYPGKKATLDLVRAAESSGADFIELGMPFSDPLADGPEVQHSSQVALANGTSLKIVLKTVEQIRRFSLTPIILMGYYNPVYCYGEDRFITAANSAGADGFIIPDLPVDEAGRFARRVKHEKMSMLFLAAPTSSDSRLQNVNRLSTDLVYAVTVTGVTGAGRSFGRTTTSYLRSLRSKLSKPFVAGFGVSSARSARELTRYSDGVVIGSALIRLLRDARTQNAGVKQVGRLLASIRRMI